MEGMDAIFTRLEEASRTGDVDSLKKLLEEDKLLLDRVITRTSIRDNPLHIAALSGQADFAAEIIKRKPELAKELNGQGLSPLHLAAAHGHLLVVKELVKGGFELCLVRDKKDGFMPLHVAVIKERPLIVEVLVEACEVPVHEVTHKGETILHLAVKSNSFHTLEFLISRVHDINTSDEKGNTVLHLAVARKQLSVINLLLSSPNININMKNSKSFTPLDVLLESPQEYGDLVLGEMIRAAGGKTSAEILPPHVLPEIHDDSNTTPPQSALSNEPTYHFLGSKDDIKNGNKEAQNNTKEKKDNPDILMVVAILIATITFQAALNPPGGFQSDGRARGQAVLAEELKRFLVYDMIGLFLSVFVILFFLCVFPHKRKSVIKFMVLVLWLATLSTVIAFSNAVGLIFPSSLKAVTNLVAGWLGLLILGILWVSFRLIVFLVRKVKRLSGYQRLVNDSMEATGIPNWSTCLIKKSFYIASIFFVFISSVIIIVFIIFLIIYYLTTE